MKRECEKWIFLMNTITSEFPEYLEFKVGTSYVLYMK